MRTARQTILIAVVLALPYLVTGLILGGPYAGRLIQGGIVLLVIARVGGGLHGSGVAVAWTRPRTSARSSSSARPCASRSASWRWRCRRTGRGSSRRRANQGDSSFWLLVALWASFGLRLRLQRGAALTTWGRPEQ